MKISIFTTNWMLARLTRVCLYSICQQDFPHDKMEVILVDDGSKDENSVMKVHQWMDMGHRVNWHQENQGFTTKEVFEEVQEEFPDIEIRYIYLEKEDNNWRNPAYPWNVGIKSCKHEIIMQIHSDMCLGDRNCLKAMYVPHSVQDDLCIHAYKAGVGRNFLDFVEPDIDMDTVEEFFKTKTWDKTSQKGYGLLPWCYSVHKKWLYQIRGYDEGFLSRKGGSIDVQLANRLKYAGVDHRLIENKTAIIPHIWYEPEGHRNVDKETRDWEEFVHDKKIPIDPHIANKGKKWGVIK